MATGAPAPRLLANFTSALVYDRPMMVVDGGRNRRCVTPVDDAVAALQAIVDHPAQTSRQIVNVGNPATETTIADLARMMSDTTSTTSLFSARPRIETVDSQDFHGQGYKDCDRWMPDISKLRAIGWKPRRDLGKTLVTTMDDWVRNKALMVEVLGD